MGMGPSPTGRGLLIFDAQSGSWVGRMPFEHFAAKNVSDLPSRSIYRTIAGFEVFNGCALLVVIPCLNQEKWQRRRIIVVIVVKLLGVFKCLSAPGIHVAIETPWRLRIVERGPGCSHGKLAGVFPFHVFVESF